jgi:hypothetical protein
VSPPVAFLVFGIPYLAAVAIFWVLLLGGGAHSVFLLIRRTSVRMASASLGLKLLALAALGVAVRSPSADCFGAGVASIAAAMAFVAIGAVLDSELVSASFAGRRAAGG